MGIGGEVVWIEKITDLKVLSDGFSVIPGNARSKILRGLDSSRCGFNGKSGDRDRSAGPTGIRVQHLVVNDDALRGIGSQKRRRRKPRP